MELRRHADPDTGRIPRDRDCTPGKQERREFEGDGTLTAEEFYTGGGYNFLSGQVTSNSKMDNRWIWIEDGATLNIDDGNSYGGTLGCLLTRGEMPYIVANGGTMNIRNENESHWQGKATELAGEEPST